jgi:hypothetical protein
MAAYDSGFMLLMVVPEMVQFGAALDGYYITVILSTRK